MAKNPENLVSGALINEMEQRLEKEINDFNVKKEKANKDIHDFEDRNKDAENLLNQLDKSYQEQESQIKETKNSCEDIEMKLTELDNFIKQRPDQPTQNQWMIHSFKSKEKEKEEEKAFLQIYAEGVLKQIHETTERLHSKFREQQNIGKLQAQQKP